MNNTLQMSKQECWRQYLVFPQYLRNSQKIRWRCPPCTGGCPWTSQKKLDYILSQEKVSVAFIANIFKPRSPNKILRNMDPFLIPKIQFYVYLDIIYQVMQCDLLIPQLEVTNHHPKKGHQQNCHVKIVCFGNISLREEKATVPLIFGGG